MFSCCWCVGVGTPALALLAVRNAAVVILNVHYFGMLDMWCGCLRWAVLGIVQTRPSQACPHQPREQLDLNFVPIAERLRPNGPPEADSVQLALTV